jgi:TonB family protein
MTRSGISLIVFAASAGLAVGQAVAAPLPSDKLAEPPLMAGPNDAEYLTKVHAHVHKRWADNFLTLIGQNLALTDPLNDPGRVAEADIVISAQGKLLSATVTKSSGFPGFDSAIGEVMHDSAPFPAPPQSARSDDDNLHLHWVFARDQRRCAGVMVLHVDDSIDVAIPKLVRAGRRTEMVGRMIAARAGGASPEPMMSDLAASWLQGAAKAPWTTVKIAAALAARGDADAVAWLKAAVKRPDTARAAGAALTASKVPVCPLVKAGLDGQNAAEQLAAAQALATAGEAACAASLVKVVENPKARAELRVAAVVALGPIDDPAASAALAAATKDDNVPVRAAALLAQVRPNAGRAKMMAMVHVLKEPAIELRAAGSAGVVRAGGDSDLNDLYMLFKDTDPRPAEATLVELERVPGEEATKMIARLAHRPLHPVQKLAAQILIRRQARGSYATLKSFLEPQTDPELRALALVAADEAQLASLAEDAKLGPAVYRARLARGERDRAADWLLAHVEKLPPAAQAEAMVDWLGSLAPSASTALAKTRR